MFKFEKFSASKLAASPTVERVVEFSPPGVEAENIAKVLSLAVDAKATTVTAFDGYAEVEGRANFKLMYLDNENRPKGVDYNADFSVKIEGDFTADDSLASKIDVAEADVEAGDALTLTAVIEVSVTAVKRDEIEALTDAEQCFKTYKSVVIPNFIAAKAAVIAVDDEISVGEVGSVLLLDTACVIRKAVAEDGLVRLDGMAYATVTFTENDEIRCRTLEIPIGEEIAIDGVESGDTVFAEAAVKNGRIVLQGVTGDNIIRFEGEVAVKLQVFRMREVELIGDMFMLTNEITMKTESVEYRYLAGCKYFSERVSGTAMLGDGRAAARDIAAIPYSGCYTAKAEVNDDGLTVEGLVNTDIVYVDENGYNSVRTEVPFSIMIPGEFLPDVKVRCVVEGINARVKRDREIEVNVTLGISVAELNRCSAEFIAEVEVGEEKEQNTSALSLYIASEGDDMWQVCKALTATPEDIMKQNPALTTPLSEGEKVIFFRSLS